MKDVEIPNWLKGLPLAPEFHPTDTEFADPIAYISKIEKQARAFGICKIIPPLPKPSRKFVLSNLNKSLSKCPELFSDKYSTDASDLQKSNFGAKSDGPVQAVFTTRQQELGQNVKRSKGSGQLQPCAVHKQVWQSGEVYTLEQFESKSKAFARSMLGVVKDVSPAAVESMFWKAASDKPIYLEYANDVPGSGFGEPQGQSRCFHRRRRIRRFIRNTRAQADGIKHEVDMVYHHRNKDSQTKNEPNSSLDPSTSSSASLSDRQTSLDTSDDMEGTAGWKLSNSPWNLQRISRSPGSLTRFMPDDIPGVTSPMIYIGMLFSWFAWHIEDHELHSLNFLHMGSPKTWYAVPGEYAFTFEEVIRTKAYGGNVDHLAALSLLGEKTTLLSPEVVIASGIPCCRLIQNPGEFVVTFPRAYHVGFSHGFNCGEAANFGTPQWLEVAKEAAVRRAAMSYLPMLSHQQLLYLLTMSFVSRVPRSFLPGARSSRLRDRQKEERELLVKKAFIEDILKENHFASVLLEKQKTYRAVLWDPDSLPSLSKESQLCTGIAPGASATAENDLYVHSENDRSQSNLLDEMELYMKTFNNLYVDDDDISCDFQVDSGTLACVACGILGFPLMCILQPSERVCSELLHADHISVEGRTEVPQPQPSMPSTSETKGSVLASVSGSVDVQGETRRVEASSSCMGCRSANRISASGRDLKLAESSIDSNIVSLHASDNMEMTEKILSHHSIGSLPSAKLSQSTTCPVEKLSSVPILSLPSENIPTASLMKLSKGWTPCSKSLRPRIFCLEHASQIEELLRAKGGMNLLVICHSDYQKMKAHADAIAEEIGTHFDYKEIPLDSASQEDLNLINLAVDEEEHSTCGEDWTSELGFNILYCVQVRRNAPSKHVKHALTLGGLFSEPGSNFENLKWHSRRLRSKHRPNHLEPSTGVQVGKDDICGGILEPKEDEKIETKKERKVIQYSRRNFKYKRGGSVGAPSVNLMLGKSPSEQITDPKESNESPGVSYAENCSTSVASAILVASGSETQVEDPVKDGVAMTNEISSLGNLSYFEGPRQCAVITKSTDVARSCMNAELHDSTTLNHEMCQEIQAGNRKHGQERDLNNVANLNISRASMEDSVEVPIAASSAEDIGRCSVERSLQDNRDPEDVDSCKVHPASTTRNGSKRKREVELLTEKKLDNTVFVRGPCEGLRPRTKMAEDKPETDRKSSDRLVHRKGNSKIHKESHMCNLDGCQKNFKSKAELVLHKCGRCPYQGCGKRFKSHKDAMFHLREHDKDRPLKCPWKGCSMSFKWAWARTEHLRVHTGERPYHCKVDGCGLSFRYVSEISRHRRKAGHHANSSS